MPLHAKQSVRDSLDDEVYSSADLSVSLPKYKFPETEQDPRHAYAVVHDELMLGEPSSTSACTLSTHR